MKLGYKLNTCELLELLLIDNNSIRKYTQDGFNETHIKKELITTKLRDILNTNDYSNTTIQILKCMYIDNNNVIIGIELNTRDNNNYSLDNFLHTIETVVKIELMKQTELLYNTFNTIKTYDDFFKNIILI